MLRNSSDRLLIAWYVFCNNPEQIGNKRLKVQHKAIKDKPHGRKKAPSPFHSRGPNVIEAERSAAPSSLDAVQAMLGQSAAAEGSQVPEEKGVAEQQGFSERSETGAEDRKGKDPKSKPIKLSVSSEPTNHPSAPPPSDDDNPDKDPAFDLGKLRHNLQD